MLAKQEMTLNCWHHTAAKLIWLYLQHCTQRNENPHIMSNDLSTKCELSMSIVIWHQP